MISIRVDMRAFPPEKVPFRLVDIPDESNWETLSIDEKLNFVFEYGQNDFQPKQCRSVSVGDVIQLGDDWYIVAPFGFEVYAIPDPNCEHEAQEYNFYWDVCKHCHGIMVGSRLSRAAEEARNVRET